VAEVWDTSFQSPAHRSERIAIRFNLGMCLALKERRDCDLPGRTEIMLPRRESGMRRGRFAYGGDSLVPVWWCSWLLRHEGSNIMAVMNPHCSWLTSVLLTCETTTSFQPLKD
jgi:hypothetical protein